MHICHICVIYKIHKHKNTTISYKNTKIQVIDDRLDWIEKGKCCFIWGAPLLRALNHLVHDDGLKLLSKVSGCLEHQSVG